jgi:site-specific DNA recombinase
MIPCALYLRYSSDRQNERSPEDQEAVCRPFMEQRGYTVIAVYVDRAKSGASVHERHDFQRMLRDAKAGLFKAVWPRPQAATAAMKRTGPPRASA